MHQSRDVRIAQTRLLQDDRLDAPHNAPVLDRELGLADLSMQIPFLEHLEPCLRELKTVELHVKAQHRGFPHVQPHGNPCGGIRQ